jgi:hypothetical protein
LLRFFRVTEGMRPDAVYETGRSHGV